MELRAVSVTDVLQDPEYTLGEQQAIAGYRSTLGVPLFRENTLIGVFSIARTRVEPFGSKEIELATSFADQAVIAIENARLFDELRERQAELRVTFDNMGDGVAMFGADKRLAAWNRNLQDMLDLPDDLLASRPNFAEFFRYLAVRGEFDSADLEAELARSVEDIGREMRYERVRPDGRIVEVRRNPVPDGGFVLIYADITERKRSEEAVRMARDVAEKALVDLQAAQRHFAHGGSRPVPVHNPLRRRRWRDSRFQIHAPRLPPREQRRQLQRDAVHREFGHCLEQLLHAWATFA